MRNIALALFVLSTALATGQIKKIDSGDTEKIGKVAILGQLYIECTKTDNIYTFTYRDINYQHITDFKSFAFADEDNAFENLYMTILNGLDHKPEENIRLELPNDVLTLQFENTVGGPSVYFVHFPGKNPNVIGKSTWMNKKKMSKLFGKRK